MPKTATITVTADAGPGLQATAIPFVNALGLEFQFGRNTFTVIDANNNPNIFDYNDTATVTFTISGSNATVTISS